MICDSLLQVVVGVACLVLTIVPLLFVWNDVYEDGFLGRISLSMISFSAAILGVKEWDTPRLYVHPETVFLLVSAAIFLCWHLWRFHRRVLMPRKELLRAGKLDRRHNFPC